MGMGMGDDEAEAVAIRTLPQTLAITMTSLCWVVEMQWTQVRGEETSIVVSQLMHARWSARRLARLSVLLRPGPMDKRAGQVWATTPALGATPTLQGWPGSWARTPPIPASMESWTVASIPKAMPNSFPRTKPGPGLVLAQELVSCTSGSQTPSVTPTVSTIVRTWRSPLTQTLRTLKTRSRPRSRQSRSLRTRIRRQQLAIRT